MGLCMPMMAQEESKTFASGDPISGKVVSVISYVADKGTGSNPSVSSSSSGYYYLKINNNNTLTISSAEGYKISTITITAGSERVGGTLTVSSGTSSVNNNSIITISSVNANSTTISVSSELRVRTLKVTYEEDLDGDGGTVYYIRNVSTGLYIKYGGSYGMDAIEGRAAHPFKLDFKGTDSKGNNIYSLASIHGYFNSMYSNASLFIDRPESESNWTLERVENTSDVYYLRGENGYALASVGNQYGILELRKHDTKDIYQKWQLITEDKLREEMTEATVAAPVDITPFIKGAAFDYADHIQPGNQFFTAEETPFYGEITEEAGSLRWNNTPVAERIVGDGIFNWEDAEHSEWQLTHSYVNYWDGFKRMEHYGARWSDDPSVGSNTNLNGIGLSRNNIHNEYMVEQYIGELPAGTYVLSYQGFYATTYSGEVPTVSVATATGDADLADEFSEKLDNYTNSSIRSLLSSSADNRGLYVATMFRDNRENDSYRGSIQFKLTEPKHVGIRIHKNYTRAETGGDYGTRYQWMIAFDDFTLIYQGNENTVVDQAILYYDRVKEAYLYYSKKVSELGEPASYPDPDTDTECHLDGCVHWTAWANAINGVVSVTGVPVDGNPAQVTIPAENNKIAYLNGTAASNKIDTEKEFLEALSKIEAAYQAAYAEHLSHATDITKETISDPSFENGGTGWTIGHDGSVATISGQTGEGLHGSKMYTTGNNGQNTWTGPVSQVLTGLAPGLYSLQASFATAGNTAYLVANGYYSGVSSSSFDTFVDHELLFLVETTQDVRIAAVGHNNPYAVDYPLYGPHYFPGSGSSFRVDNFRLKRVADLPQGRVQLALADVDAIQIDDYAKEAAFADENSLQAYRINTYTDDAAAKTAVVDIYARFRNTVKAQRTRNADMTYAIADPSFEHGLENAWTLSSKDGDTGLREQEFWPFHFTGTTGRKLFNTYIDRHVPGVQISQTIEGVPNGTYRLSAVFVTNDARKEGDTSYPAHKFTLKAGPSSTNVSTNTVTRSGDDENIGSYISVDCNVTDNKLYINASCDGWYKVDNFRLTFLHNKLALDHSKDETATVKADWYTDVDLLRPVATGKWHSFVVPYSMPVPENWDVRELTNGTIDETGTHLYMVFNRVTEMEAGTPYMVRYYPQGVPADVDLDVNTDSDTSNDDDPTKQQTNIITEYVDVNLSTPATSGEKTVTGNPAETSTLEFVGSYVPTEIPEGAIFISNNKFYVSKGTSKINGYRGYIVPKGAAANVRTLGMRTRGGNSTDIESANNEEATVVGIYDINGMLLNEMQDGLNILRMSDGTTIKIMMK